MAHQLAARLPCILAARVVVVLACVALAHVVLLPVIAAHASDRTVAAIKADIVALARTFEGLADEDRQRQRQLEPLVDELLRVSPQPPVADRLPFLAGAWRQIWGPYDYRTEGSRGIDPDTVPGEIYQVVFPGGYYWNVTPQKGSERIALLRGEYAPVGRTNLVSAQFTRFPGNKGRPAGMPLWRLAELAEKRRLPNPTTIVPELIVSWFFRGGYLREVYTDADLRITYGGSSDGDRSDEFIYVMERVGTVKAGS